MKKEQKRINSTVSFSSHPSFIIQSVDGTESKVHLGTIHILRKHKERKGARQLQFSLIFKNITNNN